MLLPHERRTAVLLVAATPVHLAISMGWAAVLATALPRGREPAWGIVGGMVIATLDLVLIGRRIPSSAHGIPTSTRLISHASQTASPASTSDPWRPRRAVAYCRHELRRTSAPDSAAT